MFEIFGTLFILLLFVAVLYHINDSDQAYQRGLKEGFEQGVNRLIHDEYCFYKNRNKIVEDNNKVSEYYLEVKNEN